MTAIERSDSFYHYNFSSSFDMVNRFFKYWCVLWPYIEIISKSGLSLFLLMCGIGLTQNQSATVLSTTTDDYI